MPSSSGEPAANAKPLPATARLLATRAPALFVVVVALYAPYYLTYFGLRAFAALDSTSAEMMVGMLGILVIPLANGAVVRILAEDAGPLAALQRSVSSFGRLLTAYIALALILIGWVAVCLIPGALCMWAFELKSPLVLIPFGLPALYYMTRYSFVDQLVVLEGKRPYEARQDSVALMGPDRRRLSLLILAVALPMLGIELAVEPLTETLTTGQPLAMLALGTALGVASSLCYLGPTTLFYTLYRQLSAARAGAPGGHA